MLLLIAFWLLVSLILLGSITKFLHTLWEIIIQIYDKKTVDLRIKFGEWAVVTGSTDGIGKAYAKELAKRNINLILISRNLEKLESTKEEILLINPNIEVKVITADFTEGENAFIKIRSQLQDIPIGILGKIKFIFNNNYLVIVIGFNKKLDERLFKINIISTNTFIT
ncbi:hypothetical protein ACFW04_001809 [Cataglyphis niger]